MGSDSDLPVVRKAADTLQAFSVPFEMHVYPDAPHGIALGNDITRCGTEKYSDPAMGKWIEHAVYWAKKFGN